MVARDYMGIVIFNSEIIKQISENLNMDMFKQANGGSYFGCCVDPLDGAVIVATKDINGNTVRIIFDGSKAVRIECGDKCAYYGIDVGPSLNQVLREEFNVAHAVDKGTFYTDTMDDERWDWEIDHTDTLN